MATEAEGAMESLSVNANIWYDFFKPTDGVRPYIGAGLGASQVAIKDFSTTSTVGTTTIDDKQTTFSYQIGAGINFSMGDSSSLSLGYRYLVANKTEFEIGDGSATVESDYKHSAVMLGLNMYLRDNALIGDEDGDGSQPATRPRRPTRPAGRVDHGGE